MILTDHIKLRFVQRVLGIQDEFEATHYLNNNQYEVVYKIMELIAGSSLLCENFSPNGTGEAFNYYINGTTIFVINRPQSNLPVAITLYDVEMDKDSFTNLKSMELNVKQLKQNNYQINILNSSKSKKDIRSRQLETTIDRCKSYLDSLEQELEKSVEDSKEDLLQIKDLKKQNREIMENLLYGYKKIN